MVNYEDIGARIRARREHLGLTTNRAAQKIGCTPTTLKRWEEGDIKSIKTSRMKEIADALSTTPEALLGLDTKVIPAEDILQIPLMRTVPVLGEIACGTPALAEENFDGMAKKTMLRQLISKWGIMSTDMVQAMESDNGIITTNDNGMLEVDVPTTESEPMPAAEPQQTVETTVEQINIDEL